MAPRIAAAASSAAADCERASCTPGMRGCARPRLTAAHRLSFASAPHAAANTIYSRVPAFLVGTMSLKESMSRRKSSRRQLRSLCGEVHPDDGVDPRDLFRSPTNRKVTNRKTLQLCSQVADTLNLVLSGECADDVLQSLHVVAVKPAPNASQLLVVVSPSSAGQNSIRWPSSIASHERTADSAAKWPLRLCENGRRNWCFSM